MICFRDFLDIGIASRAATARFLCIIFATFCAYGLPLTLIRVCHQHVAEASGVPSDGPTLVTLPKGSVRAHLFARGAQHMPAAASPLRFEVTLAIAFVARRARAHRHHRAAQDALRSIANTEYAWLAPEASEATVSKRSALSAALDIGARSREEALSAAVRAVVDVSRAAAGRMREYRPRAPLARPAPPCACWTCPAGR